MLLKGLRKFVLKSKVRYNVYEKKCFTDFFDIFLANFWCNPMEKRDWEKYWGERETEGNRDYWRTRKIIHSPEGMIFYQKNEFAYCKYTNGYGVCINYSYLLLNRLSAQSLSWPKHDIQITLQEKSIIPFKSK